ncbi:CDP-glycerol glycerophosphotransferase family protein [Lederbergia wuyishanensis]|uniref:CDP-glycerol glycerophosphotransferase (TagB/SpsB family) n=1 Tax=Lederbergia wuyishanensis TaxID=1347903 RepID=A0ABU0D377_9BACI|nr:CDP-glycerol glycerophosphotransferase family protein [Lederbergia wuyishanensis]MCJ8007973.1 CDP-glycerol glycerophosphotransferase family protein [Lederbergia wuyishanensis]MDQ0342857.1 CDP-glycerol glycerophosphotransferase (TagB/SpsB family) [Lederbergia wuyishanensis]
MVKDIIISLYLLLFKIFFNLFKLFPLKNKLTFVISFGDNSKYVYDEIQRQKIPVEIVVLYKGSANKYFKEEKKDITIIPFESVNIIFILKSIFHLATSKHILIDNYFGFLAATNFKSSVKCIQLWHASGALKKFGLEDMSVQKRSTIAQKRFLNVYSKFQKVIVGSDIMADIFIKSFNLTNENILKTGIPRSDFFYNVTLQQEIIKRLYKENDLLRYKKKILYAPTYRDGQLNHFEMQLDIKKMQEELGKDHILILRIHPSIKNREDYSSIYPGFVFEYSSIKYDINEILLIADYLITDYSSIPYEFSLLKRPMIFFTYDLEKYKVERGLTENFESMVPGPVVKQTSDVINLIREKQFNPKLIDQYATVWNKYSTGNSSTKLVNYLFYNQNI